MESLHQFLILPAQGHGGELLEGRLELVLVLRLEKHIVVRGLGVGVLLQGIVDVVLLRHRRKRLDVLLRDLNVGQGGPMLFELVQGLFSLAEGALGGLLLHLLQHLLQGLLEQVRGHLARLHREGDRTLGDFFLHRHYLLSPPPYRSWLTREV